jgi:short subunit dehydrogenase-like uncharacterized protein
MPEDVAQTGPIAVCGATGYTGRLVAAELRRRGAEFVLSGRNPAKLEILAEEVGGADTKVARLDDSTGLRELLEPCAAVISCAGPRPTRRAGSGRGSRDRDALHRHHG